jgi:hypothetical protein
MYDSLLCREIPRCLKLKLGERAPRPLRTLNESNEKRTKKKRGKKRDR